MKHGTWEESRGLGGALRDEGNWGKALSSIEGRSRWGCGGRARLKLETRAGLRVLW